MPNVMVTWLPKACRTGNPTLTFYCNDCVTEFDTFFINPLRYAHHPHVRRLDNENKITMIGPPPVFMQIDKSQMLKTIKFSSSILTYSFDENIINRSCCEKTSCRCNYQGHGQREVGRNHTWQGAVVYKSFACCSRIQRLSTGEHVRNVDQRICVTTFCRPCFP